MTFDSLRRTIALSGKEGLHHCATTWSLPPECFDYYDYTHISWDWFINLTEVTSRQPLLFRWNMSETWIHDHLRISPSNTFLFNDSNAYHFRFLDTLNDSSPSTDKFKEDIYIPHLAGISQRLIQIGTLFGTSRLRLKNPQNLQARSQIRRSMTFANPILVETSKIIAASLSLPYLGAHVRVGDGKFKKHESRTTRELWWKLVHGVLGFELQDTLALERKFGQTTVDPPVFYTTHAMAPYSSSSSPPTLSSRRCRGRLHTASHLLILNTPLYISTDVRDPVRDPSLSVFRQTFPCLFFLGDFADASADLDRLVNGHDGIVLKQYLLPFLDAMVVARAHSVVGTHGSTFSDFVQNVLWMGYHGLDVIDRG